MDPPTDPQAKGVYSSKSTVRAAGKTPSEPKTEKDTKPFRATVASRTYSHPHLGKVIFTAEEQDAVYREAATTLPKKLRDLKPTWYRHSPDGPQVFVWLAIAQKGQCRNGFYEPELNDELSREMAPRLEEVETREALKKLNLPVGSDGGLGFRRGTDVSE
ncbi:MAG: hypothetical protein Q9184_004376 [Pyrenodesmia sp. 2 TL-2023]